MLRRVLGNLTTQFVFYRVLDLQGRCARDSCALETVLRRAPLGLIGGLRHTRAAKGIANRHGNRALRVKQGGTRTEWSVSVGWCKMDAVSKEELLDRV